MLANAEPFSGKSGNAELSIGKSDKAELSRGKLDNADPSNEKSDNVGIFAHPFPQLWRLPVSWESNAG